MRRTAASLLYALLGTSIQLVASEVSQALGDHLLRGKFHSFMTNFYRHYTEQSEEYKDRYAIFGENLERIVALNSDLENLGLDKIHGITRFADQTEDEFAETMLMSRFMSTHKNDLSAPVATPNKTATEKSFDWRLQGVVTDVKDQGRCGSCWAFSATETLESMYALKTGNLVPLSVQQVVSCDTTDHGCNGGMYDTAWTYVQAAGGLDTEEAYPYDESTSMGAASPCNTQLESKTQNGTNTTGYAWATPPCSRLFFCSHQDEDLLKDNLVSTGPISIAVDASSWSSYAGGVLTSATCKNSKLKQDHAVQLVGYNEEAPIPYWIVRNSWSTDWGENGYIFLEMGKNTCGLADSAALVKL